MPEWHNECLVITLEHVRLERKLDLDEERDVYWLEGWAYVLNMDNSRYKRKLLLIDKDEKIYELALYDRCGRYPAGTDQCGNFRFQLQNQKRRFAAGGVQGGAALWGLLLQTEIVPGM